MKQLKAKEEAERKAKDLEKALEEMKKELERKAKEEAERKAKEEVERKDKKEIVKALEELKKGLERKQEKEPKKEWWRTFKGQNDTNNWILNEEATEQVKKLAEQQPKIPEGSTVEYYHIPNSFLACEKAVFHFDVRKIIQPSEEILMIPRETRSILQDLYEIVIEQRNLYPNSPFRTLLIGTPGIGKSFSSSYFIRLLMKKKVPFIVFETQKDSYRYLIALRDKNDSNSGYDVYSVNGLEFNPTGIPQLRSYDSWYICDHAGKADNIPFLNNCIQCCFSSPAESNYKEWRKGARTITLPPPSEQEAEEMIKYFINSCSTDENTKEQAVSLAESRMIITGPVLRRIMEAATYQLTIAAISTIGRDAGTRKELMTRAFDTKNTEQMYNAQNKPNSFAFIIYPKGHSKPVVDWASPTTKLLCILSSAHHLAQQASGTDGGKEFELLFKALLISGIEFELNVREYSENNTSSNDSSKTINFKIRKENLKNIITPCVSVEESRTKWRNLKYCKTISDTCDDILIPCENFPLVDFMDKQNRGYQITTGKTHTMNFIKNYTDSKIIEYFKAQNWTESSPLHLVYITRHDTFSLPKKFTLPDQLKKCLKVYFIVLDTPVLSKLFEKTTPVTQKIIKDILNEDPTPQKPIKDILNEYPTSQKPNEVKNQ